MSVCMYVGGCMYLCVCVGGRRRLHSTSIVKMYALQTVSRSGFISRPTIITACNKSHTDPYYTVGR